MDGNHPKNFDARPKRRKAKDNPYQILTTGIHSDQPHYYLSFVDSIGEEQFIEIDGLLFKTFDRFELDDLSQMNKVDRHYERSELTDISLNKRAFKPPVTVEDTVFQNAKIAALHNAIEELSDVQRRRLILYYFCELTYARIAEMEGCTHSSVAQSIKAALHNLKKLMGSEWAE